MTVMPELDALVQTPLARAIGWALLQFVWQGALLGALTAVLLAALRRSAADVRYVAATIALSVMITIPIVGAVQAFKGASTPAPAVAAAPVSASTAVAAAGTTPAPSLPAAFSRKVPATQASGEKMAGTVSATVPAGNQLGLERLAPWLVLGWVAGVLLLTLRLLSGWIWVQRLKTHGSAAARQSLRQTGERLARRLHISRTVTLLESSLVDVPTVIGWLKPVILFPASALAGLNPIQLDAILAHELAHIRRHDYLVNLLQTLVETLLFYHPAVWWVSRQIRIERENCCDDLAVSLCGDAVLYAQALADLEHLRGSNGQLAMAANGGSLLHRVRRLLGAPSHEGRGPGWLAGSVSVVILVAMAGIAARAIDQEPGDRARTPTTSRVHVAADQLRSGAEQVREGAHQVRDGLNQMRDSAMQLRDALHEIRLTAHRHFRQIPPPPPLPPDPPEPLSPPEPPEAPEPPEPPFGPDFDDLTMPAPPAFPATPAPPAFPAMPAPPAFPAPPAPPGFPATPAPPAFPATPAPPAMPGVPGYAPRQAVQSDRSERRGNFTWTNNGEKLEVQYRGDIEFTDDDRDVKTMTPGGSLWIREGGSSGHTVEFRPDGSGGIERRFWSGSSERPFEPEGRKWLALMLPRFIRQTGLGAEGRVARVYKAKGTPGVLAEISLVEGSWAKRLYFGELLKTPGLDTRTVPTILTQAGREVDSDFELASLLISADKVLTLDNAARKAYFDAARSIGSDFETRRVFSSALKRGPLTPELLAAVLETGTAIDSDFELASLLVDVAKAQPLGDATRAPFFKAVDTINSSFERRRVLTAVLRRTDLSPALAASVLDATADIESDFEAASVLVDVAKGRTIEGALREPFFRAVASINSGFERGRVLQAVAKQPDVTEQTLLDVIKSAKGMTGSFETAQVLLAVAATRPLGREARDEYIAAADKLGDFEQGRVMSALIRNERRR